MQSLLGFKPEVIHQLAIESGVDLATIELLKKHDISTEQLLQMLQQAGVEVKFTSPANPEPQTTQLAASDPNCLSTPDQLAAEPSTEPSSGNNSSNIDDNGGNDDDDFKDTGQPARASSGKKNPHTSQHQDGEFVTYIYTHPDNDEKDKIGNPAEDERRQKLGQAVWKPYSPTNAASVETRKPCLTQTRVTMSPRQTLTVKSSGISK